MLRVWDKPKHWSPSSYLLHEHHNISNEWLISYVRTKNKNRSITFVRIRCASCSNFPLSWNLKWRLPLTEPLLLWWQHTTSISHNLLWFRQLNLIIYYYCLLLVLTLIQYTYTINKILERTDVILLLLLLVWHAPLGVRSATSVSEWTILSHSYRLIQGEMLY